MPVAEAKERCAGVGYLLGPEADLTRGDFPRCPGCVDCRDGARRARDPRAAAVSGDLLPATRIAEPQARERKR